MKRIEIKAAMIAGLVVSACLWAEAFGDAPRDFIGDAGSGWDTTSGVTVLGSPSASGRELHPYVLNGSGISADGMTHVAGSPFSQMWWAASEGPFFNDPVPFTGNRFWAEFKFLDPYVFKLSKIWIWNYNEVNYPDYGMKEITVYATAVHQFPGDPLHSWGSANGSDWTVLYDGQLPQAPGNAAANVFVVDVPAGFQAAYVIIVADPASTGNHNWNGSPAGTGLSEVRFYEVPDDCDTLIANGWGLASDLSGDCRVDLGDFAMFAASWLDCMDPKDPINCL